MENELNLKEDLTFMEKFSFGCGDLGINFTWASLGMFVTYFYTDVIGVSALVVSSIMLISRCFDGVSDVIMGAVVDKTKSKYGKARPWMIWGGIPFAIITVLLFTVPAQASDWVKTVYIFCSYNLLMLAFTAVAIPYGILNSMITQDRHQREVLNIFRMFLALVGVLIVTNLTLPIVDCFGGQQLGWIATYAIFAVCSFLFFVFVFVKQKERVKPIDEKIKIPLRASLGAALRNKHWILTVVYFVVYSVGYGLNQIITIYYAKYILNDASLIGYLTLAYTIPTMIGFLVLHKLFEKFGKRKCMIWASVISIFGYLLTLYNPESLDVVLYSQIIKGAAQTPLLGGLWALLPDTIEYGEWKTGIRNEGLLYSGGSLGQKIGIGLGVALAGYYMSFSGYDGTLAVQNDASTAAIMNLFIIIPVVIYLAQILILFLNNIDAKYQNVLHDLSTRRLAARAKS